MPEISATEASKRFADVLDAVEHRGEPSPWYAAACGGDDRAGSPRHGRRPTPGSGQHPPDDEWADDLRDLRRFVGEAPNADPWTD